MVFFGTEDPGEYKGLDLWGADTAWLDANNVRRSVIYMGKPQTDVIRFSFTGDWALDNGDLSADAQDEFDERMAIVNAYTNPGTALYLNNDTDDWTGNPYLAAGGGVDAVKWAELIAVTAQKAVAAGHPVLAVSIFNEPDHATWQGDVTRFGDVAWQLRYAEIEQSPGVLVKKFPAFDYGATPFIRIMGANTLNNDRARDWGYDQLNTWGFLEEGNTHQLAGNMPNYIDFYETVQANGDVGTNDELHNVMEAMVGAEYGMDAGIWWGTAERARGEFVKASDGDRLAYAENRPNWTAASVYRAPDGKIQAFVGESERQAIPTTYRFVSKDRPVFYDGHGPQRAFDVTTTGEPGGGYQTANHHNAEKVVNITWGDDVQPVIDGRYIIVARHSRKVMDVYGGPAATGDGANIDQWTYNGGLNQQWDVNPIPSTAGGDYSYFSFAAAHSGKFPDVVNFSYDNGGDVQQYGTPGSIPGVNQQWFLEYAGDGWFYIRNRWSGKYLDVNGGVGATGDGANIHQWEGPGGQNQQWRFLPVDADPTDVTAPSAPLWLAASANAASVQLNWAASPEADVDGYTVMRSLTPGGPYEIIARGITDTAYTDNEANQNIPYFYVVNATDRSLNRSANSNEASATPTGAAGLVAHYDFECALNDHSKNGNHGVANGTVGYAWGGVDESCLNLDGDGYVSLPAEVVNHDQVTIAAWVNWDGGAIWQRIFDFGNGTDEYLFLTPFNGGNMQFSIRHNGVTQYLDTSPLTVGQWRHVAVTLGNGTATLYVNGAVAASTSTSIKPSDFNPVLNYIGKSQYSNDPLFNGAIDDFRIYNYALSDTEVSDLASVPVTDPTANEVISWNLDWSGTVGDPAGGTSPNVAGVVPVPNWNNSWYTDPKTDLRDNTGAATTLDIAYSSQSGAYSQQGGHPGQDSDGTYNKEMLNGYLNGTGPAGASITLSQIPYADYDIYVYFAADDPSRSGTVTDGTTTYSFNVLNGQLADGNALFAQTTDTGTGYPEANYAVFSGLSGPSQTISTNFGATFGGICAIQVVRTMHVIDTTPPVITLSGDSTIILKSGIDTYSEAGATVSDECDASVSVVIGGQTVDPNTWGTYIVTYNAMDEFGNVAAQVIRTVVVNAPPVVDPGGPYTVDEGGVVTLTGTATDEDGDDATLDYAWDLDNNGSFETLGAAVDFDAALLDGPSTYTVALQVTDARGYAVTDSTTVEVLNVAPTVESITAVGSTADPIAVGGTATLEVSFSDPGVPDTHEVNFDWGDNASSTETPGANPTMVTGSHTYTAAGVYEVAVEVIDDDGDSDTATYQYIVVYDPKGGFVTGGGQIQSPAGAYTADPDLTGQANFGFVSKYKKGATVPTGVTQFEFQVASLNFHSEIYQWLVVAGGKAMFKGSGTINGQGNYGFLLSAIDGSESGNGSGPDTFRIKIWDAVTEAVVYDNALGLPEDADPPTALSGGSIVVHSGNGK